MARRRGRQDPSAASRLEPAARPAAQPDGLRPGQRRRQDRGPRGDRAQSGGRQGARHRDGDVVRVHNARGSCLAGAIVSDAVSAGVVKLSCGAWYDPADASERPALPARQCQCADPRPGHLEARPGAKLGNRAGRGRALRRTAYAGRRLRSAASRFTRCLKTEITAHTSASCRSASTSSTGRSCRRSIGRDKIPAGPSRTEFAVVSR